MMRRVGATLAADYFLLVEMFGRWALVSAVVPLLALQVAACFRSVNPNTATYCAAQASPHAVATTDSAVVIGPNYPVVSDS